MNNLIQFMNNDRPIGSLKNIGHPTAHWLNEVQIETICDLEQIEVIEAYQRVKALYQERVSLNLLYALHAGLLGIKWTMLPQDIERRVTG